MFLDIHDQYTTPQTATPQQPPVSSKLSFDIYWAQSEDDIRAAQRLRYRVFSRDMRARLTPPLGTPPGLDADAFDPFCEHLLVRAPGAEPGVRGPLLGTCRVLPPAAARRACGLYVDTEFDLQPLQLLRKQTLELGRSCVHPAWRTGTVIMALWRELGQYMLRQNLHTMIGCASIPLTDGGHSARMLWQCLQHTHLAPLPWRVQPRTALPLDAADGAPAAQAEGGQKIDIPPLLKGYLRCGARLLGPPALDVAFNTADLPMVLCLDGLAPRYRKHFLGN